MTRLVLVAFACLLLVNCATVFVNAPPGRNITLLSNEPTSVKITMRNWYVLWGLIPLTNNNTASMIGQVNLSGVRVRTFYRPLDFIENIFLSVISLHTNTVVIEGQPGK
jgi:hypothetical protein